MRLKNSHDAIIDYISQWVREDDWDALQCILNAATVGCPDAIEYASSYIANTGCIDPKNCYEWGKTLEEDILLLAKRYRKLSKKRQDLVYDRVFDEVLMVDCQDCNHVCFVHSGNEELYPEVRHNCWQCKSETLNIRRHKAKKENQGKTGTGQYKKAV